VSDRRLHDISYTTASGQALRQCRGYPASVLHHMEHHPMGALPDLHTANCENPKPVPRNTSHRATRGDPERIQANPERIRASPEPELYIPTTQSGHNSAHGDSGTALRAAPTHSFRWIPFVQPHRLVPIDPYVVDQSIPSSGSPGSGSVGSPRSGSPGRGSVGSPRSGSPGSGSPGRGSRGKGSMAPHGLDPQGADPQALDPQAVGTKGTDPLGAGRIP
jgi:hypothetical protein